MKRIILFLALLSLGVSKAQVVGGYLPLNSTKSATMGGLKVSGNETVTGTFSVGSTATITGALKASSTMSLGSANLTGGNTGTVAVLSDAVFCLNFIALSFNPFDGSTYTLSTIPIVGGSSSTTKNLIPENCEAYKYDLLAYNGTTATAETSTIQLIQNTNLTTITSAFTSTAFYVQNTGTLSVSYSANDLSGIRIINPTWSTNPTVVIYSFNIWFRRKQ